jgi:hypothetical protein
MKPIIFHVQAASFTRKGSTGDSPVVSGDPPDTHALAHPMGEGGRRPGESNKQN